MSSDELRYDRLVETALLGVVRQALQTAVPDRMPGDHHFYLTFRTRAPGVSIPDFLLQQYPEEMTIVLQHQFWDLKAGIDRFEVTLSFNNRPANLVVPYAALTAFIDPSVKFGLQFNPETDDAPGNTASGVEPANGGATPNLPAVPPEALPPITAPSDEPVARAAHELKVAQEKAEQEKSKADDKKADDADGGSAEVVSLDSFRKK
jgi:hypothetical protein